MLDIIKNLSIPYNWYLILNLVKLKEYKNLKFQFIGEIKYAINGIN